MLYYGLMRIGEVTTGNHPVLAKDIYYCDQTKKLLIVLHSSKTHGRESKPQKIKIQGNVNLEEGKNHNYYCPYLAIQEYLLIRGDYHDVKEQLFIFRDRTPVRPAHVRAILRRIIKKLNLNSKLYDTHSFRMGRATDLRKAGYTIDDVKQLGRWKSNAVYKYLKF